MNPECIFCKIVAGELPAARVYEDAHSMAFLDINPIAKGHTLVIPREHYDCITDAPQKTLADTIAVVKLVAAVQIECLGADGVNVTQANGEAAGQIIPHLHFHVIPRFREDGRSPAWKSGQYDNADEIGEYAAKIRNALSS